MSTNDITDGVAETTLCIDPTPGLNPHAQAEPGWLPAWTVDGDDAEWLSTGEDDDGRWSLSVEPHYHACTGEYEATVWSHSLVCQMLTLTPEKARALRHALGEWLTSIEGGGK